MKKSGTVLSAVPVLIHLTFKTAFCVIDGKPKHREGTLPKAPGWVSVGPR